VVAQSANRVSWLEVLIMKSNLDAIVPTSLPCCIRERRYPVAKRRLLAEASRRGAPRQMLHVLRRIPRDIYRDLQEILQDYKRVIGVTSSVV